MLRQSSYFFASMILALLVFVVVERTSSPLFQSCISETGLGSIATIYIRCSGRFIEGHGVGITALGTLVIAGFTGTLWFATDRLTKSGQRAFEATERAFVFIDGFNVELTTATDIKGKVDYETLPQWYRSNPELYITRFALQPRWKNGGNTPTRKMTIQVDWRGPPGPVPPIDYVYRTPQRHSSSLRRRLSRAQ
jgi:hypothetical protein